MMSKINLNDKFEKFFTKIKPNNKYTKLGQIMKYVARYIYVVISLKRSISYFLHFYKVIIKCKSAVDIKMITFKNVVVSLKAMWIKQLLANDIERILKPKWKGIQLFTRNVTEPNLLLHKLDSAHIQINSLFHSHVLESWY